MDELMDDVWMKGWIIQEWMFGGMDDKYIINEWNNKWMDELIDIEYINKWCMDEWMDDWING